MRYIPTYILFRNEARVLWRRMVPCWFERVAPIRVAFHLKNPSQRIYYAIFKQLPSYHHWSIQLHDWKPENDCRANWIKVNLCAQVSQQRCMKIFPHLLPRESSSLHWLALAERKINRGLLRRSRGWMDGWGGVWIMHEMLTLDVFLCAVLFLPCRRRRTRSVNGVRNQ